MADSADFQQPAPPPPHGDTTSEQPDGAVVTDALPNANGLLLTLGLQGVVLQSSDGNGGGESGVQREHCTKVTSGEEAGWIEEQIIPMMTIDIFPYTCIKINKTDMCFNLKPNLCCCYVCVVQYYMNCVVLVLYEWWVAIRKVADGVELFL